MTHDELLAQINTYENDVVGMIWSLDGEFCAGQCDCDKQEETARHPYKALRAVVELHKVGRCKQDCCDVCLHCYGIEDDRQDIYPCPTIQAIEKELQ